MHTILAKFGALALAPFLFFGASHGQIGQMNQMLHRPATTTPPSHHQKAALSITGVDGPSALAIGADGTWTVDVTGASTTTNLSYSVKWGDEPSATPMLMAANAAIQSSATFTHEYDSAGTYQPEFTVTDQNGHSATKSVTVTVGAQTALHLDSVTPTSGIVGSSATVSGAGFTASSTVTVGGVAATDVTLNDDGTISFAIPSLSIGTYNVRVHDGSDRSNAVSFQVTAATPTLSVSGIDAPVTLAVGASGTWTVHASTSSSNLHYSVVWGDESPMASMLRALGVTVNTSGTFTHTYETAGTYAPKFTVSDDSGHSESMSASVVVQ